MSAIFEQVRGIAADLLGVPPDRITSQSSPEDLESWDSVQHLNITLALEQQFQLQFDPEEIDQMRTIGQIATLLEQKLARHQVWKQ